MGIIVLLIGVLLFAYSRVFSVHDSTAKAMGAVLLKTLAGWGGGIAIIVGILLMIVN